jgi:hypothetical protein
MGKKIKITENQLKRLISKKRLMSEGDPSVNFDVTNDSRFTTKNMNEHEGEEKHYMFFNSLEEIKRKSELLLSKIDHEMMDKLLDDHDWASAHITTADNNLSQVFDFFMNKAQGVHIDNGHVGHNPHDEGMEDNEEEDEDEEEEEDMMNKNIKGDDDDNEEEEEEDKDDEEEEEDEKEKDEMNESIQKIKANFKRFL